MDPDRAALRCRPVPAGTACDEIIKPEMTQFVAAIGGEDDIASGLRRVMTTSGGRSRCVPRKVTTTLRARADVRLLTLTRRAGRRCAMASNTAGRSVLATCSAGRP